ncbi:MAG: SufD family Fe-S cluster assembly protein, partial [Planctomycetales bacterium]|nr:SufD family Fe-S cluster assembly protein [Planctomycetales bacterium]
MDMNELTLATGFTQDTFDAFLATRREPNWLTDARRQAWQAFLDMPMPSRSEEEWTRTDIRPLKLDRYQLISDNTASLSQPMLLEGVEAGGRTVSANGTSVQATLETKWRDKGVIFADLADAVNDHEELVKQYLYSQVNAPWPDRLAALHAACWTNGTFLYVPRGVTVDQPLHSLCSLSERGADLGHTLVILEEGAGATYLNELGSPTEDASGLHCGATEVVLQAGAHMRFVTLQDWGRDVWHFAHQRAAVARDASLQWTVGALGSRLSKVNQQVELVGQGAECQVNGVMFTEGRQHLSYHTLQHHRAAHCQRL